MRSCLAHTRVRVPALKRDRDGIEVVVEEVAVGVERDPRGRVAEHPMQSQYVHSSRYGQRRPGVTKVVWGDSLRLCPTGDGVN